ncbi:MAG: amino acid racemase [Ignavibacteriae bacterium]|nr:amino acid racemase [Ignavibacteriota bacterium]
MAKKQIIGVVGGVGPYAGLDLVRNVFDETIAQTDQQHLPVVLMSLPENIGDRTGYLLGASTTNPARSTVDVLQQLENAGVTVAGIPCNTMHAPRIFDAIIEGMKQRRLSIQLLHMVDEAVLFVRQYHPHIKKIGLLSTNGTAQSGVYQGAFERVGIQVVLPPDEIQQKHVHSSIYDPTFGIKAFSNPVTAQARQHLLSAISGLRTAGVDAVILGCTEIPLAIPEKSIDGTLLLNPTTVLARALISKTYPDKLKPLHKD